MEDVSFSPLGISYAHYYEGSIWSSKNNASATFSAVGVIITVPSSEPVEVTDDYAVVVSIFDNAYSYDQIGLQAINGSWWVVWSVGVNCATTYYYSVMAHTLIPNTAYKFEMSVDGKGNVDFTVWEDVYGSLVEVWSYSYDTGGTSFEGGVQGYWTCQGTKMEDYTDYEEMHNTTLQDWPDFDFDFVDNSQTTQSCQINGCPGSWSSWNKGNIPSGTPTQNIISGNSTYIENEWFNASITSPPGLYSIVVDFFYNQGGSFWTPGTVNPVCSASCPNDNVEVMGFSLPSGWSCAFNNSRYPCAKFSLVPMQWDLELNVSPSTRNGTYVVTVEVQDHVTDVLTFVQFSVTINHIPEGGGGCVATGTPILTPSGYVDVQALRVGDVVVGYNLTTDTLVDLTLTGLNKTLSEPLVSINHGLLVLTATDQPVYIWNESFEGWVVNPDQLRVGDYMFNPIDGGWTEITALSESDQSMVVYDVVTSGTHDFIANGELLDLKKGS